jgi:hypothetical protein
VAAMFVLVVLHHATSGGGVDKNDANMFSVLDSPRTVFAVPEQGFEYDLSSAARELLSVVFLQNCDF